MHKSGGETLLLLSCDERERERDNLRVSYPTHTYSQFPSCPTTDSSALIYPYVMWGRPLALHQLWPLSAGMPQFPLLLTKSRPLSVHFLPTFCAPERKPQTGAPADPLWQCIYYLFIEPQPFISKKGKKTQPSPFL